MHIQDPHKARTRVTSITDKNNEFSFKKQTPQKYSQNIKNSSKVKQNLAYFATKHHNQHLSFQKETQQKTDIDKYIKEYEYNVNGNLHSEQKKSQSGKKSALRQWSRYQNSNQNKGRSTTKAYEYSLDDQKAEQQNKKDLFIYSQQFNAFSNQYQKYSQGKIVKQLLQQNRLLKLELSTKDQTLLVVQAQLLHIKNQYKQKMTYFIRISDQKQLQIDELSQKIKVYETYIEEFKRAQTQRNQQIKELLDTNFQLSNRIGKIKQTLIDKNELILLLKSNTFLFETNKIQSEPTNASILALIKDSLIQKQKFQQLILNIWKMKNKVQVTNSKIVRENSAEKKDNFRISNDAFSIQSLKMLWSWIKKIGHQYSRLKQFNSEQRQI